MPRHRGTKSRQGASSRGLQAVRNTATARFTRYSRLGTGNLSVDGSGNVTPASGLGGFSNASTGTFVITPANLGISADLAVHFSSWRLHRLRIHYIANSRIVTTTAGTALQPGLCEFALIDDPGRLCTTAPSSGQLQDSRVYREVPLDRNFVLDVTPVGPQAKWLECSVGTTTDSSTLRQSAAGAITFVSSLSSSLVSGTLGRLYCEYDISFKGAAIGQTPTLEVKAQPAQLTLTETKRAVPDSKADLADPADGWHELEASDEWTQFQQWLKFRASRAGTAPDKSGLTKADPELQKLRFLTLDPG